MTTTRPDAHRLRITPGDQHVRVSLDGVVIADSRRPVLLQEGTLPTRYYLPRDDVRMELLEATDASSHCPFKGDASYWSLADATDVAWSYETPIEGADAIAGLVCFYNERVDIELDGEPLERPATRWS